MICRNAKTFLLPFDGHKYMDPSEIPQFEEGEKEAIAQKLLEEAGTSHHYE